MKNKIDYKKTKLNDRKQIVEQILNEGQYEDYFDERFKANLNSTDNLSSGDEVCGNLEKLANYLLNADEVKEDKKSDDFEYKFYSDEEAFQKAVNKEPKIDGMGGTIEKDNVIHFLKKEKRNFKASKNQRILKSDKEREDELGHVLRQYADYLEIVSAELNNFENSKLSRFQITNILGQVKDDMINAKDILLGTFGYKTNAEESTVIDWDRIDFTNENHVRALLYMRPGHRSDEDLQYIVEDFCKLVAKSKPTKLQKNIIGLMRENKGTTEIGKELSIPKQNVEKNIKMLVKRICKLGKQD